MYSKSQVVIKFSEYADADISDYQYVNHYIKHLPNFDKIKSNAFKEIDQIKSSLAKSIILNELRPGLIHWTTRLQTFIYEYGLFFTKKDHLKLIKLYLEIIYTPDIDLVIVDTCFSILVELLKKYEYLTRNDLVIDWKPIYKLYLRIHKIDERSTTLSSENIEEISFLNFVSFARIYFDEYSTREILDELRTFLCPFDLSMSFAFERLNLFLPSILINVHLDNSLNLWLKEFLDLWLKFSGKVEWESIFSKTIRGLGLSLAAEFSLNIDDSTPKEALTLINTLSDTFAYTEVDIDSIGLWMISMIGATKNRNLCLLHIKKLFHMLRSYFYPSNTGHMENFFTLLQKLPEALIERIRFEKLKKYEWMRKNRRADTYIRESDIVELVLCLKDVVLTALFSKTNFNEAIKTYQHLCFLKPDIMIPPLIDQIYTCFETTNEPHRYTPLLACLVSIPRELVSYNNSFQTQKHVIDLLISVLPGIDINDLNKFILTFQFLTNILGHIIVCDCSPAIKYRSDLSEYEKELCNLTVKFEDFINELFNKIFYIIDDLNSESSMENLDSPSQVGAFYSRNGSLNDESVSQVHVVQLFKILVSQSSKPILKLIVKKVIKFITCNSFNHKSGDILGYLCGFLVTSGYGKEAFEKFFEYVYDNLIKFKNTKNSSNFIQSDKNDNFIMWNLHLFSYILKANGQILLMNIDKIKELINLYKSSSNKRSISHLTNCFNNLITSLTKIYPKETCSVGYSLIFDNEMLFFSKHLPIRDWGTYISVKELQVDFHIPSFEEISTALEIVDLYLNESMNFLRKTVLFNRKEETNSKNFKLIKEEIYRELNYIYHITYASSTLLKRPSNQKYTTEHIDSVVNIGLKEDINKGLGYEIANLNDKKHEYSKLSDEEIKIMLNKREILIEFSVKMLERLIDEKSNDTIMLILLSRILYTACSVFGTFPEEFEKTWKNHSVNKSTIQNKLIDKKYPREELIHRIMLQYTFRSFHLHISLNELDHKVINVLINLAINSSYEIVRTDTREKLFDFLGQFPYSALTLLPNIIKFLNKTHTDKKFTIEQLEGCLLLLKGDSTQTSMLVKQNWFILGKLWPALFKCKYSETDSSQIQKLLDNIYFNANLNFDSFNNRIRLNEKCVSLAYELSTTDNLENYASDELRLKLFNQKCLFENQIIAKLMDDLIDIASDTSISWKNREISLFSLIFLLDSCHTNKKLLTAECVELFVYSLVHENINFRRISIDALCIILKMTKPDKQKKTYETIKLINEQTNNKHLNNETIILNRHKFSPGYRLDNKWVLFDENFLKSDLSLDESESQKWENTIFLDKSYSGYYSWPTKIEVNLNKRHVYSLENDSDLNKNDFAESMKPLVNKFQNDSEFVLKFIQLSQIEETKGNEKFDKKKFYLFKSLFRNFGSTNIFNNLFEHLNRLIADKESFTHECSHKLASEILSGLIRGSKYWSLNDLKKLWSNLEPLFILIIDNITSETLHLWIDSFSKSFEDQDPKRMHFYLNYIKNFILKIFHEFEQFKFETKKKPSFRQTINLHLLSCLNQFEWKIPSIWSSLVEPIIDNFSNPSKSIREIISSLAILCVSSELDPVGDLETKPKINNLSKCITLIETKLNKAIELYELINDVNMSEEAKKSLQRDKINDLISHANFFQSLLNWLNLYLIRCASPFNLETLRLIPMLCKIDKLAKCEENLKANLTTVRMFLPIWSMDLKCISLLIEYLKEISNSNNSQSREAVIQIIKNFSVFNIFILNDEQKSTIKDILLNSLIDEEIKVRLSACVALSSIFHSNFLQVDDFLIDHFKYLSKTEYRIKDPECGRIVTSSNNLGTRHGGLLGLCSIVNSCPYEVPKYLPDVITYLCDYVNDPNPIQESIKKCLNEFKRTHSDNWKEHQKEFNENQLSILSDILISPSYYA